MAELNTASATGAQPAPDLRRRNVPSSEKAGIVDTPDIADYDQKKARPTVGYSFLCIMRVH